MKKKQSQKPIEIKLDEGKNHSSPSLEELEKLASALYEAQMSDCPEAPPFTALHDSYAWTHGTPDNEKDEAKKDGMTDLAVWLDFALNIFQQKNGFRDAKKKQMAASTSRGPGHKNFYSMPLKDGTVLVADVDFDAAKAYTGKTGNDPKHPHPFISMIWPGKATAAEREALIDRSLYYRFKNTIFTEVSEHATGKTFLDIIKSGVGDLCRCTAYRDGVALRLDDHPISIAADDDALAALATEAERIFDAMKKGDK